jgi:hypothetical protein
MKKSILGKLLIYSILFASTLLAQDSLSVIGKFIQDHSWTMDFGISSNLTLSAFKGTALSLSKFTSDYQRYRFGISTNLNNNSRNQSGSHYDADTLSGASSGDDDNDAYSVQITLQYITYATPRAQTSIYFGIGPLVGISWSKSNSTSNSSTIGYYQDQGGNTSSYTSYSVGALGSCGVEWFFSEHISIHAEYGLVAQYIWSKNESSNQDKYSYVNSNSGSYKNISSSSSSGWSLSGQNVLFGLSVNY